MLHQIFIDLIYLKGVEGKRNSTSERTQGQIQGTTEKRAQMLDTIK